MGSVRRRPPDTTVEDAEVRAEVTITPAQGKVPVPTKRLPPRERSRPPTLVPILAVQSPPVAQSGDAVGTAPTSAVVADTSAAPPNTPLDAINRQALDRRVLDDPAVAARVRREVAVLKDVLFQGEFLAAAGLDKEVSSLGARAHLLQFREAAGGPTDPVEQLLLDVLALARVRVARVHALAEQTTSPELIRVYLNTGCRLMSEISKTALALAVYRGQSKGNAPAAPENPNSELASAAGSDANG